MGEWTHLLTDIAPVQMLADRFAQRLRDRPFLFYRLVRDALSRIQQMRRYERVGRARIQTARAAAATVRLEWIIRPQLQVQQQLAKKEERSQLRIDQQRVLAHPSQSRTPPKIALQYRPGIHVRLAPNRMPDFFFDPALQLVQPVNHQIVIVVAARVPRDRPFRLCTAVVHRNYNSAAHSLERPPRIMPLLRAALQIRHVAGITGSNPLIEVTGGFNRAQRRDANQIETKLARAFLDAAFQITFVITFVITLVGGHFRTAQRTYCSASWTDGVASGDPYAVSMRQRTYSRSGTGRNGGRRYHLLFRNRQLTRTRSTASVGWRNERAPSASASLSMDIPTI